MIVLLISSGGPVLENWLDQHYEGCGISVIEHPTVDFQPVPNDVLTAVTADLLRHLSDGRTVVLMDSGGASRVGQVCKHLGAKKVG